ncbi:MAG: peptidase T [Clostridiales bacterium]|nr:peptidase T [Clostridiales bacterium]MDD7550177.1 peptidase T [Clostridia bacterium]
MTVVERFLKYVSFDTQSDPDSESTPSTPKQKLLGQELVNEMHSMGIENARMDEHGYVYAHIDANTEGIPSLGFIAHMDTSSDASGADIKARIEKKYNGGDIRLNEHTVLSPVDFPKLLNSIGQDIIVTDGTTLLGADDKAGIAEILTMAEELINNPEIKHGKICIGFTPDEEVGRGADLFDVEGFGAEYAYTVDGGEIGEIEYENFNAASAKVSISGRGIHPGSAKDRMINSIHVAQEFDSMLPQAQRPEYTEGYEGFIHLMHIEGDIENTKLVYIIRDHDMAKFEKKKSLMVKAAELVNLKYGEGTLKLTLNDSYYNMREKIQPHIWLVSNVQEIMRDLGVEPITTPVRGGTDGARLSFMGLPCPNICTGGLNFHGRFEYIPVQSMEKVCSILLEIVKRFR